MSSKNFIDYSEPAVDAEWLNDVDAIVWDVLGGTTTAAGVRAALDLDSVVNVKYYGAVCDGITDDSTAVQAAIDSFDDYVGGVLYIPANTAIGTTLTITNKKGLIITGSNGQGFPFPSVVSSAYIPTLKWIGAANGTMVQITNVLRLTLRDMSISGENIADYGLKFSGTNTGWGVSNYYNIIVHSCEKNAVLKTATASAGDFGRNHWERCGFRISHTATGTEVDDAAFAYNKDSSVYDVFDHCEFHALDNSGTVISGGYGLWFESGSPRVLLRDCYTKAENGIYCKSSGTTPKLTLSDHYSEDTNFISLPAANAPQVLRNCSHVSTTGGSSIIWGGSSGGGVPLIIDSGVYKQSVTCTNANACVVISNNPNFQGAYPTFTEENNKIIIGRANTVPTTETHAAINANCFVPYEAASQSGASIYAAMKSGSIFPVLLTVNATILAPTGMDADGLDVGRAIEYRITGDAGSAYTVTFNAVFKLAGGTYTHSGIGATDIISFRWDGTNWNEIYRTMNIS